MLTFHDGRHFLFGRHFGILAIFVSTNWVSDDLHLLLESYFIGLFQFTVKPGVIVISGCIRVVFVPNIMSL